MKARYSARADTVHEEFTNLWGDVYYVIEEVDRLKPFFINLASSSDHWLFLSSRGGISAGRRTADNALFPYVNVDQIHHGSCNSGAKTTLICEQEGQNVLWEPFTPSPLCPFRRLRKIYKNVSGTSVVFEEHNISLGLRYQYGWTICDTFGFVKESRLLNDGARSIRVHLLDGLHNILPTGISEQLYLHYSSLTDAYKQSELDLTTGLGIFSLTGEINDRPSPKEMLVSTVVWHRGLESSRVILQATENETFLRGEIPRAAKRVEGARCQYSVHAVFDLPSSSEKRWLLIADVAKDHEGVAALQSLLADGDQLIDRVDRNVEENRTLLDRIVSAGDGLQLTADMRSCIHHRTNVLFNVLRGGLFSGGYSIDRDDFLAFLLIRNRPIYKKYEATFRKTANPLTLAELWDLCAGMDNPNLERLAREYLPLTYSRRHGDPSRPWNKFEIDIRNSSGKLGYHYEGNWRDIFQNWEALARAYPHFLENFIAKFVNASTVDGYNPYRINRTGIEWEKPESDKAWSNIGYWGDHQVIYLLKLLEMYQDHFPEKLSALLEKPVFSYAHVPYRLASFERTVKNPKSTVTYAEDQELSIRDLEQRIGADARLLHDDTGNVYHVCLLEKLLLVALSKLANFVPEGGIWMNTQRPEWNDANNALAGYGLSMVTTCHLRRFFRFFSHLLRDTVSDSYSVSAEIIEFFNTALAVLRAGDQKSKSKSGWKNQYPVLLGPAASDYRDNVYQRGFSTKRGLPKERIAEFLELSLEILDSTIRANQRDDGLYHSYNLIEISKNGDSVRFGIKHLPEMLEGQVAVLSSGHLSTEEGVSLLGALEKSTLYDTERKSYLLYPDQKLPGFMEKNRVPPDGVTGSRLLSRWEQLGKEEQLIYRDAGGDFRFRASIVDLASLENRLIALEQRDDLRDLVLEERHQVIELFEDVFSHRSYTGRSSSMFGYEGLGSIYWHMVSKLLCEIQNCYFCAIDEEKSEDSAPESSNALSNAYHRVRSGLGYQKTAKEFGAFPTDPYSHTPKSGEARQPGMTGQVKEGILIRLGELGVHVRNGRVYFEPWLLEDKEYLHEQQKFVFVDQLGARQEMDMEPGSLVYLFCGVPIIYTSGDQPAVTVHWRDGDLRRFSGHRLNQNTSRALFLRDGSILKIVVKIT